MALRHDQRAPSRLNERPITVEAEGTWPGVLSARYAFVNQTLAPIYGLPALQGDTLQQVAFDSQQRFGLLTQLAVLAGTTSGGSTSPTQRGRFVREQLLCRDTPSPHAGAPAASPSTFPGNTARQRWAQAITGAACLGCHAELDQIGFSLENYDDLGRYRTQENGEVIDASAQIAGVGSVQGPLDLAQDLATLPETQACFAKHWLEFGYGRSLSDGDTDLCLSQNLNASFKAAGYNVRELLLQLTQTDAFLYLPRQR